MDQTVVRCPYCVEDGQFKIMTRRGEGGWYICVACTHTVVPDNRGYRCKCVKCTQIYELGRGEPGN